MFSFLILRNLGSHPLSFVIGLFVFGGRTSNQLLIIICRILRSYEKKIVVNVNLKIDCF